MTTATTQSAPRISHDEPTAKAAVHALARVRRELMAIPIELVESPNENVPALVAQVLAWVAARSPEGAEKEVSVAHLELLALALHRAHDQAQHEPARRPVYDCAGLVAKAQQAFDVLEEELEPFELRGQLNREQVRAFVRLRRARTLDERCNRIHDVADAFSHDRPAELGYYVVDRARRLASTLRGGMEVPGAVSKSEMLARAYSALRQAFGEGRCDSNEPTSGVFTVASLTSAAVR